MLDRGRSDPASPRGPPDLESSPIMAFPIRSSLPRRAPLDPRSTGVLAQSQPGKTQPGKALSDPRSTRR